MTLLTTTFISPNEERMKEILHCLEKNCENREILFIQLMFENFTPETKPSDRHTEIISHPKIRIFTTPGRMTFNDWFDFANRLGERVPREPMIVANSDIYFDDTIKLLNADYLEKRFVCLSRRHATLDQVGVPPVDLQAPCAQDAWAFMPPLRYRPVFDFTTGCRGCDNRIAAEMSLMGYPVSNPCESVHAFHVHASRVTNYGPAVPGPHMNVNPMRI